jgi:hypothetical protein
MPAESKNPVDVEPKEFELVDKLPQLEGTSGSIMKKNINKYSINLMWINSCPDENGEYICAGKNREGLNFELGQLRKWSFANPEAVMNFWYDSKCTNVKAIENTKELLAQISNRVHLRDIQEMPFVHHNSDLFLSGIPVYFRIDFLKLILSLHLLEHEEMDSVIYTDMSIGANVENVLSKKELFHSESVKNLNQYGMFIGKDTFKSENQFLQMLNTPQLIESLKHAINCCLLLTTNTLNRAIKNQTPHMLSTLHNVPFITTKIYIYVYLLALQSKEPVRIRADVVKEGNQDEWVIYEPLKHGYLMFGNFFVTTDYGSMYLQNGELIGLENIVKLPECLQFSPDISKFTSFDKEFQKNVLRCDLHPSKPGSDHCWYGDLPLPVKGNEFSCIFWPKNYKLFAGSAFSSCYFSPGPKSKNPIELKNTSGVLHV